MTENLRVKVADYAVARGDAVIATLGLGSCVAIAIYDPATRIGGLAHVLLPSETMSREHTNRAKFPSTAVPLLLEEMAKLGATGPFAAKLVGGASMFGPLLPAGAINMGYRNVEAARRALIVAGIAIMGEDVGGGYGRSAFLHLIDGRVVSKSLTHSERVL